MTYPTASRKHEGGSSMGKEIIMGVSYIGLVLVLGYFVKDFYEYIMKKRDQKKFPLLPDVLQKEINKAESGGFSVLEVGGEAKKGFRAWPYQTPPGFKKPSKFLNWHTCVYGDGSSPMKTYVFYAEYSQGGKVYRGYDLGEEYHNKYYE